MCNCEPASVCSSCKTLLDLADFYETKLIAAQLEIKALRKIIEALQKQIDQK
jgi:hypothetical protein